MLTGFLAFFLDTIIGDPRTRLHPVVLMGNLISLLERVLYRQEDGNGSKFRRGILLVLLVLLICYGAACGILHLSYRLSELAGTVWAEYLISALLLCFMISPKSLAEAGREICGLLMQENLAEARRKVGWIVGRDTDELTPQDITRAAVETIAENTVDGIIAPLFFFAIGGVPLAVLYRAANTMDSMVGYRNEKYLYFGRAAARLDDALNYVPARITGILFVFAAWILGFDHRHAFRVMKRDADKHPSPNGGYAEATVAGALHIRLGGMNSYFGKKSFRAYMGDALQELGPRHIMASIRLMYTAATLFLALAYFLFLAIGRT